MKTNLDLFLSAQQAARDLLTNDVKPLLAHAVHTAALEKFDLEQHAKADWDYWFQHFTNQRTFLAGLASQKTVGQVQQDNADKLALAMKPKTTEANPT